MATELKIVDGMPSYANFVKVEELTRGMTGLFFCDAGYLKKAGDLSKLSESGIIICAATRKNMKRL